MMQAYEAETIIRGIIDRLSTKLGFHAEYENQDREAGKHYKSDGSTWARLTITYADSEIMTIGNKPNVRDVGSINVQVFAPIGSGTIGLSKIASEIRTELQSYTNDGLEIWRANAPISIDNDDFYGKLITANFRLN